VPGALHHPAGRAAGVSTICLALAHPRQPGRGRIFTQSRGWQRESCDDPWHPLQQAVSSAPQNGLFHSVRLLHSPCQLCSALGQCCARFFGGWPIAVTADLYRQHCPPLTNDEIPEAHEWQLCRLLSRYAQVSSRIREVAQQAQVFKGQSRQTAKHRFARASMEALP